PSMTMRTQPGQAPPGSARMVSMSASGGMWPVSCSTIGAVSVLLVVLAADEGPSAGAPRPLGAGVPASAVPRRRGRAGRGRVGYRVRETGVRRRDGRVEGPGLARPVGGDERPGLAGRVVRDGGGAAGERRHHRVGGLEDRKSTRLN